MAVDELLTQLSSNSPSAQYRKITIYSSTRLGLLFRKAALKDGFRLVDFARVLVTIGLTATLLSLDEAWVARERLMHEQLGATAKRSYTTNRSTIGRGVWIAVCLPAGVLALVDKFARSSGLGQNGALESFLRLGLASYLHGKITLLKAIKATAEKMNAGTPG